MVCMQLYCKTETIGAILREVKSTSDMLVVLIGCPGRCQDVIVDR